MTVKVISERSTRSKRVVCPTCCYLLEYTGIDIQYTTDCDGDTFRRLKCPRVECKTLFTVEKWD